MLCHHQFHSRLLMCWVASQPQFDWATLKALTEHYTPL